MHTPEHANYLQHIKQLVHQLDQKEVDNNSLASIQLHLDKLAQRYQNDESLGTDRYLLYQAQAMICYWQGNDSQAVDWMRESIKIKGSGYEFADDFLAHVHQSEEDLSVLSLKASNNYRFKSLNEQQKTQLRNKLIFWRIGSFILLNLVAFFTIGVLFGFIGWFLIMS